ncbi:MAG: hypothetical protein JW864_16930 [Spirochaetes bacterium]|nr:hypothetical protein [Spirochaetota bacterium]
MNIKRLIWRAFSINNDELGFVLPLFLIYFLSGSFFAVGQIFSETIFLKTYGAKGFSSFFIQNGIAIIITGILYNYYFLKIPMRRGYVILISSMFFLILTGSIFHAQDLPWFPFYIYMANYLFTVFLDIHFFNYAFQHLSLRNSKRILPFLMGGGKLGGIISSLIVFYIFSKDISNWGMFVWAVNGGLILIPVLLFKKVDMAGSGKSGIMGIDRTSDVRFLDKLFQNIKYSFATPSFICSALIAFIVSIINQISEYYSAAIFNAGFATKNELSAFLSLYTLGADFITLFFQLFVISRMINGIGVRKANFVYPVSFL